MTLANDTLRAVLAEHPRVHDALHQARERAGSVTDVELLALCEHRMCQLLGAELPVRPDMAPNSIASSALGQAALVFVEQWVIGVANITNDMVESLRAALGDDDSLMDFVHAILTIEQRIRLDLAWRQLGIST